MHAAQTTAPHPVVETAITLERPRVAFVQLPTRIPHWRLILLVLVPLLMRLPGALVVPDLPYSSDEEELVRSSVDRFLGVPPTSLAWPAIPIQFADTLIVACQLSVTVLLSLVRGAPEPARAAGLSLARLYEDPTPLVTISRLLVALGASLGPLAFVKLLTRFNLSTVSVVAGVVTFAASPIFWENSHIVKGDALALPLLVCALAVLPTSSIRSDPRSLLMAGALLGVATATRILSAPGLVCLFAIAAVTYPVRRWPGVLARLVAGFAAGALLACPFWWTDPVRAVKSVLGSVTEPGPLNWQSVHLLDLDELVGWPAILLAVPGLIWIFRARSRPAAALILSAFMVYLLPVALSRSFFPRYLIPVLPFAALLVSFGVELFVPYFRHSRFAKFASVIVVSTIAISSLTVYVSYFVDSHSVSDTHQAANLLRTIASQQDPIVLDGEFQHFLPPSSATLTRVVDRASSRESQVARVQTLFRNRGIQSLDLQPFVDNFNEVERAAVARTSARLLLERRDGYNLWISEPAGQNTPSVYQDVTSDQAIDGFQSGRFKILVSTARPAQLGTPAYSIGRYSIYSH